MANMKMLDDKFTRARRQESKAHNELDYYARQASGQKSQLDHLLQYKEECVNGLQDARKKGLKPVHMRELQLLMTHINSAIETAAYKVEASQENYENAKAIWKTQNTLFERLKEEISNSNSETLAEGVEKNEESDAQVSASSDNKDRNHHAAGTEGMLYKNKFSY